MRVIIAGSRNITSYIFLKNVINYLDWKIDVVLCGMAKGVDQLGHTYALSNNIPIEKYPADWRRFGMSAGMIRNREMANKADALIALWNGYSRGTKNMIEEAHSRNLKVFVNVIPSIYEK